MGGAGNLWERTWDSAPVVPAARQSPLFDATSEAEKVLNYLETVTATQLLAQVRCAGVSTDP